MEPYEDAYMHARLAANRRLYDLGVVDGPRNYILLKRLLGNKDVDLPLSSQFTEDDYKTCLLLAGPHTYTIYKVLCLKHGLTEEPNG